MTGTFGGLTWVSSCEIVWPYIGKRIVYSLWLTQSPFGFQQSGTSTPDAHLQRLRVCSVQVSQWCVCIHVHMQIVYSCTNAFVCLYVHVHPVGGLPHCVQVFMRDGPEVRETKSLDRQSWGIQQRAVQMWNSREEFCHKGPQ